MRCRLPTHGARQARRPLRDPRPDDPQDAVGPGAAARLPHRAAHRADQRRPAGAQPGDAVSGADQARAARMDRVEVGRVRERPPGQGLLADARGTETARRAGSAMAPRHRHRRALLQDFGRPAVTRLRHHARRLLASLRSRRMDDDFRDEIAGHLAEATDEFVRRGLPPDEARLAALRSFGRVAQIEEIHRDVRAYRLLDDLRQDLRHTRRSLARNPGFTIVAVLTLTLGIGANSTIFTLLDAVVLKPLPLANPQELVTFYENGPEGAPDPSGGTGRYLRFSYGRFERLQHALAPHGSLAATTRSARLVARLPGESQKRFVSAQFVSGDYFATLGVPAARGRAIAPADAAMDRSAPVAVVSDGFWRRSLGGSDDAVGRTLVVNDVGVTVIGIAPRGFFGLWSDAEADLWLPVKI